MTKQEMIERIKNLEWGQVLWHENEDGSILNINDYNEESDSFNAYGDNMRCFQIKYEDIPQPLYRC